MSLAPLLPIRDLYEIQVGQESCYVAGLVFNLQEEGSIEVQRNDCGLVVSFENGRLRIENLKMCVSVHLPIDRGWVPWWYRWGSQEVHLGGHTALRVLIKEGCDGVSRR